MLYQAADWHDMAVGFAGVAIGMCEMGASRRYSVYDSRLSTTLSTYAPQMAGKRLNNGSLNEFINFP